MTTLDILIPTYNRAQDVLANLTAIQKEVEEYGLQDKIQVIISDNASPDDTQKVVANFKAQYGHQLQVVYHRNNTNIGLEPNAVQVLTLANSDHVLFIGDDDFFAKGYLQYCITKIEEDKNLGCIIPGCASLYPDGTIVPARLEKFKELELEKGFDAMHKYSHLGHSMSGVLCKRDHLLEDYLAQPEYRNPYLFLYFVANRMYHYKSIYAPHYKTIINTYNVKDWGYNKVGLLDDVYLCYLSFHKELSEKQIASLLLRFTVMHSYRLAFKPLKLFTLIKQYLYLINNTPKYEGFRLGLFKILLKDYLLSFKRIIC